MPKAQGDDINSKDHRGWTLLHKAAAHGRLKAAASLIEQGADINIRTSSRGEAAIQLAAYSSGAGKAKKNTTYRASVQMCKLLKDAGADVESLLLASRWAMKQKDDKMKELGRMIKPDTNDSEE